MVSQRVVRRTTLFFATRLISAIATPAHHHITQNMRLPLTVIVGHFDWGDAANIRNVINTSDSRNIQVRGIAVVLLYRTDGLFNGL